MRALGINLHATKGLNAACELDDESYLQKIAALGFTHIFSGVFAAPRQAAIADICSRLGLTYETLHAPFGHINDIWLDDDNGMLDELLHCIDHCVIAGAGIAVVHLSSGQTPPPITDAGRGRFTRLVEYAAKHNVKIAFENQRMLANLAWAMETFPRETAGFCWDCGHEACFTPGRHYMPLFADRLICTHIHDNPARFNEDFHMLPFDGACDFDEITKSIRTSGYTGSLMLEVSAGKTDLYANDTPDTYLQKAYDIAARLRQMVDGKV